MATIIDVAGASMGGAARLLVELDKYLDRQGQVGQGSLDVTVIGRGERLTPSWLVRREVLARHAALRLALNNVSFVAPRGRNVALLRNAFHFATPHEIRHLWGSPPLDLRAQGWMVRTAGRSADVLVAPCTAMKERVIRHAPYLSARVSVRHHPVATPAWAGEPSTDPRAILVPVHPTPYKRLEDHVGALLQAAEGLEGPPITVTVTATAGQMPSLRSHPRINFIGAIDAATLAEYWRTSQAVYYPTAFEAFGYPLAEAAVSGRYVIAQATSQNREIAHEALREYRIGDLNSLRQALQSALRGTPAPDSMRFQPQDYFDWLLGGAGQRESVTK